MDDKIISIPPTSLGLFPSSTFYAKRIGRRAKEVSLAFSRDTQNTDFALDAKTMMVDISKIHPTQNYLDLGKIFSFTQDIMINGIKELPFGVKIENDIYILDGHHRVAAAYLLIGEGSVMMRLLEISRKEWLLQRRDLSFINDIL